MKKKITNIAKNSINPVSWKSGSVKTFFFSVHTIRKIYIFLPLLVLLLLYMLSQVYILIEKIPFIGNWFKKLGMHLWNKKVENTVNKIINRMEGSRRTSTQRMYLIYLANKNLKAKKSRTLITILGMSVGIAIIVFLLSLGYGVEKLVISKIATLDQLKIIDVVSGTNSAINLNRASSLKIAKIKNVKDVVPIVSTVGRISLNHASTDVLVKAVPTQFFGLENITPEKGQIYNSTKTAYSPAQEVAGVSTSLVNATSGENIDGKTVQFNIDPENPAPARLDCNVSTKVEGLVARQEGGFQGQEVWGSEYYPFTGDGREGFDAHTENALGVWVKGNMPLFFQAGDDTLHPILDDNGRQLWEEVCIQKGYITNEKTVLTQDVLGISTSDTDTSDSTDTSSDSAGLVSVTTPESSDSAVLGSDVSSASADVFFQTESVAATPAAQLTTKTQLLNFKGKLVQKAVVSEGLLQVLNIKPNKAVGTKFNVSFILTKNVLPDVTGRAYTESKDYEIVGVVQDTSTPYFYIPFEDILKIGDVNYSQLEVRVNSKNDVANVRKNIEALGFRTSSTLDTVQEIESLFANLRLLLGLLGLVALGVASLGMFNTLTVSLLERTREIGGMKTMGMVSDEIEDLLLSEAMIMGLTGGIVGLILGDILGKILSFGVSLIAFSHGQGYLDLTYIPFFLTAFILISSFVVGILTGILPAIRARKISALNALRYE
jgi:ABC-type antimicrobial peptide transport system permease subunit